MDVKKAIKKLESSQAFKEYKQDHPDSYMTHIFFMTGNGIDIGYYTKKNNLMASFNTKDQVTKVVEEQPFQKTEQTIKPLIMNMVHVDMEEALETAVALQKEKYSAEQINKEIIILQELDEIGLVYNITFITETFKTLNIKIDAKNKKIVHDHLVSLISF